MELKSKISTSAGQLSSVILRRMLMLLSLPLLNTPLQVSAQVPSDTLRCAKRDTVVAVSNDSLKLNPDYNSPVTVTPCYGVMVPVLPQFMTIIPQKEDMIEIEFMEDYHE